MIQGFTMFPLTRILPLAATGAFVAFTAVSTAATANELVDNLGPVSPFEPILATVNGKRIIAFYHPDDGNCAVHLVVWNPTDENADSTAGFEATLSPRQMGHIDAAENESMHLQCSDHAEHLALIDTSKDTSKCIKFVGVGRPSW